MQQSESGEPPASAVGHFLIAATGLLAAAPDLDVISLKFVPYSHTQGHRGVFHSPFFLILFAALLAMAMATHPILDAMPSAGLGVLLYFPWNPEPHFFSWRPFVAPPFRLSAITSVQLQRMAATEPWLLTLGLTAGLALRLAFRSQRHRSARLPG